LEKDAKPIAHRNIENDDIFIKFDIYTYVEGGYSWKIQPDEIVNW
jgi:hypothetical protein